MTPAATVEAVPIPRTVITDRGTWAMLMFIATEATLFVCLFFAYYYLGYDEPQWPPDPPKLPLALAMLAVLVMSSVVLHWGERRLRQRHTAVARAAVAITIVLGLVFIGLQTAEYWNHLKTLRPTSNAYGSIFYTITGVHGAHVLLGLLMLGYVLALPRIDDAPRRIGRSTTRRSTGISWISCGSSS